MSELRGLQARLGAAPDHGVRFFEDEESLRDFAAEHCRDGLSAGEAVVAVVTGASRNGIGARLKAAGLDVDGLQEAGELTFVDVRELLEAVLEGSTLDEARFREEVGEIFAGLPDRAREKPVRIYGEIVDVLWRDERRDAGLQAERIWNELADDHRFRLVCACNLGHFSSPADADLFGRLCREHVRVVPAEGYQTAESQGEGGREVARLQQRSLSLDRAEKKRRRLERLLRRRLDEREAMRGPVLDIVRCGKRLNEEAGDGLTPVQMGYLADIGKAASKLAEILDEA